MDIDQLRDALQDRNARVVSERTGVGYQTILRLRRGQTKECSFSVYAALHDYLTRVPGGDDEEQS